MSKKNQIKFNKKYAPCDNIDILEDINELVIINNKNSRRENYNFQNINNTPMT